MTIISTLDVPHAPIVTPEQVRTIQRDFVSHLIGIETAVLERMRAIGMVTFQQDQRVAILQQILVDLG